MDQVTHDVHRYRTVAKVGEGAFGTVFRARDTRTGTDVALKRIRVRDVRELPTNALREMNALRRVRHPHVVPLLGVHTHGANLVLVMPFQALSLATLLAERDAPLAERHARTLGRMLFCGLAAIHAEGLVHRDIKPHNLLLSASGALQVADFGQARLLPTERDASLSHAVASRWYRAPELLLGSRRYGSGVDLWAAGCVVAQLSTLSVLLPGDSDIDQLFRVVAFLGSPSVSDWPGLETLPDFGKIELPTGLAAIPLRAAVPGASEGALHLLGRLLLYDATRRLAARTAIADEPWLSAASPFAVPVVELLTPALAEPPTPPPPPPPAPAPPPPPPQFPAASCQRAPAPPEGAGVVRAVLEDAEELLARLRTGTHGNYSWDSRMGPTRAECERIPL